MEVYVVVPALSHAQRGRLADQLAGHRLVFAADLDPSGRGAALAKAEVIFGNPPQADMERAMLNAPHPLRWLQLETAGTEAYARLNATRTGAPVLLSNLQNFFGRAVSETAIAGMLAYYRQLPRLLAAQSQARWIQTEVNPDCARLHGRRVLILGAGEIARRLRALLLPFECEVRLFARRSPEAQLHTPDELDAELPRAEVLINALPHSPETAGLLDRARIGRFRPGLLFVNVGRGSVIDEPALIDLLRTDPRAGAVLDVTAVEPLPSESPLWTHPRVILSQHTGGRFEGEMDAKIEVFLANFRRFERGEQLHGLVQL